MRRDEQQIAEFEEFLINDYNPEEINIEPRTENELLLLYQRYTVQLYDYISCMFNFSYPISNEIRAMLGHLSEYRSSEVCKRDDLHNAYGHFRRANLDALKIICNELDRSLLKILKEQYNYDYRNVYENYLKEYCKLYFDAQKAHLVAQEKECVGSDRNTHNIFALYYSSAKQYIELKQFYRKYKSKTRIIKWITNIKKSVCFICSVFGIFVTIIQLLL